jgi:predicted dehydrogenase
MATRYGALAYSAVGTLFGSERLDAVIIATPPDSHHLMAKAAAEARVPMLIETPLALTRATMDLAIEAARAAGVPVEVGENYGRRPLELLTRRALDAGLIGRVLRLSAFNAPANHDSVYHGVGLLCHYAVADVAEVQATAHRVALDPLRGGAPSDETWVDAVLAFRNGVTASVSYVTSWVTPLRWGRPRFTTIEGTAGYLVNTAEGTSRLHYLREGAAVDAYMDVETQHAGGLARPVRFSYGPSLGVEVRNPFADRDLPDAEPSGICDGLARAAQLASLYRAVTGGVTTEYDLATARRSQEIAIAIIESARLHRPVAALPDDPTEWEHQQHERFRQTWGADPIADADTLLNAMR